jgi:multiple sugar transport system permease protein
MRPQKIVTNVVFYLAMIFGATVMIFPVIYMFSASLMSRQEIFSTPIKIFPEALRFSNYIEVFTRFNIHMYLNNSIIVAVSVIAISAFTSTLVGYSLAKFQFPGKQFVFYFIIATMMIPFTVIVIPLYLLILKLNWANSYEALIIPSAMTPFGVFLLRQFILDLPDDYIDAARIDGSSEIGIFLKIIMPLSISAISATSIMTFVSNWNSFLWPLIVTSRQRYMTLPLGLAQFLNLYEQEWHLLMTSSVIAVFPVLVIFLLFQRKFIEGMTGMTGLKA